MTGLCCSCIHAKEMRNDRASVFLLCVLSQSDPRYPKYPRLPVLRCRGYQEQPCPKKDNSFRALIDKLNVKPGARVLVLGVNDGALLAELRGRTDDCSEGGRKKNCDVILLGVESFVDLRKIEPCRALLAPAGGLWVIYPKGQKHITEAQVMSAGLATGMVDNKVVSFSPTHTGIRFVIRKADRV